jgi:hypothetical protein
MWDREGKVRAVGDNRRGVERVDARGGDLKGAIGSFGCAFWGCLAKMDER